MNSPTLHPNYGGSILTWLVIATILGVVVMLLFPAMGVRHDGGGRPQVKNDAMNIATGILTFQTEYGRPPIDSGKDVVICNDAKVGEISWT